MGERRWMNRGKTGIVMVGGVLCLISLLSSFYYNYLAAAVSYSSLDQKVTAVTVKGISSVSIGVDEDSDSDTAHDDDKNPYCGFRRYPPHRYYQIEDTLPYYKQVQYIHGRWPVLLPQNNNVTFKVCLQRDHVDPVIDGQLSATLAWPYIDGTNPSLLHIPSRIQTEAPSSAKLLQLVAPKAHYLVAVILKDSLYNSQCAWNDDTTLRRQWPSSETGFDVPDPAKSKVDPVSVELLLLDKNFRRLAQATLKLENDLDGTSKISAGHFDDPRLFIHQGAVNFAFTNNQEQWLTRIGFSINDKGGWLAAAQWAETRVVSYGRNMAMIPNRNTNAALTTSTDTSPDLHALTWIDPVTVVEVDKTTLRQKEQKQRRRLQQQHPMWTNTRARMKAFVDATLQWGQPRRRLQDKPSSHIHGTNGFMVPFVGANQYLGIGHFHREDPSIPNTFSRWVGHHYTHAFFTLTEIETNSTDTNRRFQLTGLSAEFVFAAAHNSLDAHIIQFASGLEYNPFSQQVIIGYGINDCESALTVLDLQTVLHMLKPVNESDKQVIDYMMNLNETNKS